MPVISVVTGKVLGVVQDLDIAADQKLAGLYIKTATKELRFLPLERVTNLGRDAVLVQGEEQDFTLVTEPYNNQPPTGAWVMTAEGKSLGTIDDIVVEGNAGSIVGYEISDGLFMDMLVGRKIVTTSNILTNGQDAVIVEDS